MTNLESWATTCRYKCDKAIGHICRYSSYLLPIEDDVILIHFRFPKLTNNDRPLIAIMSKSFAYEELTWPEIAALTRDIPIVIPLGEEYSMDLLVDDTEALKDSQNAPLNDELLTFVCLG